MRQFLLVLLLLLLCSIAFSQPERYRWSAGCSVGIHFPQMDFASTTQGNDKAGYAIAGYRLSLPLTYFLYENFGVSAHLLSQKHDIDRDRVFSQLGLSDKDILKSLPWSFEGFLAGPFVSFAADGQNTISVNIKFSVGMVYAALPVLGTYLYYYDSRAHSTRYYLAATEPASDIAFAFLIDAGIQYRYSKHLALALSINYFSSQPEFENIPVVTQNGTFENSTYKQPVNTVGLDCGIVYLVN